MGLDWLELETGENIELTDEFELTVASIELVDEEVTVATVLLELTDILDELVTAVFEEAASRDELDVSSSFSPPQPARATPKVNIVDIVNILKSILVTSIIFVSRKGVKLLLPSKSLLTSSVTTTPRRLVSLQNHPRWSRPILNQPNLM